MVYGYIEGRKDMSFWSTVYFSSLTLHLGVYRCKKFEGIEAYIGGQRVGMVEKIWTDFS